MANRDYIEDNINKGLELGVANAALMPEIHKWCAHIEMKDVSGGLMAMSGLPTNVQITCQHAHKGGSSGMQLEWIAGRFVEENCIGCSHHKEVEPGNFGRRLLAEKEEQEKKKLQKKQEEDAAQQQLRDRIEAILPQEKARSGITELSILKILERLVVENVDDRKKAGDEIVEAARMHPDFFTPLSLDVLLLYFSDEQIGSLCVTAVSHVVLFTKQVPDSVANKTAATIEKGMYIEESAPILKQLITKENYKDKEKLVKRMISLMHYQRGLGDHSGKIHTYPAAVSFIKQLVVLDAEWIQNIFKEILKTDSPSVRINITGLLRELIPHDFSFVSSLVDDMIESLELDDERFMDSSDHSVCRTLAMLVVTEPEKVYGNIVEKAKKISNEARVSLISLYRYILRTENFTDTNKTFVAGLISEMIETAMLKTEAVKVHEKIVAAVNEASDDHPQLFTPHFETLIGYLLQMVEDEKTFKYWQDELANKKPEEQTTFNPLIGKQFHELNSEITTRQKSMRDIKDVIKNVYELDPQTHLESLLELFRKLESKIQEEFKIQLFNLISSSVNDPVQVSKLVPDLYQLLLDPDSENIRFEALKFLEKIIRKFPQVVTVTLLDLVDVFLKDPKAFVKGMAFDILGTIAKTWPEKINDAHIEMVNEALIDRYKFVSKKAVGICDKLIPVINDTQKLKLANRLVALEDAYYKEKDWSFCETLMDQLLRLTKTMTSIYKFVVQTILIKYCTCEDFHTARDFTKNLGRIKKDYPEFETEWLKAIIGVLQKTHMDWGDDERKEDFAGIYDISYEVVEANLNLFTDFLDSRTEKDAYDIVTTIAILSHFGKFEPVEAYTKALSAKIPDVAANQYLLNSCILFGSMAQFEFGVNKGNYNDDYLNQVRDAYKKD